MPFGALTIGEFFASASTPLRKTTVIIPVKGGFQAKIDYPNYQFGFDMEVLLYDDGSFTASIPEYSIRTTVFISHNDRKC